MIEGIKSKLYNFCITTIEEKLRVINSVLNSAQTSANHETKSTAGDKHDTARAMAHLESEKNAKQLAEINKLKKVLPYLKDHKSKETVDLGSLVITSNGNYYLSISLGKTELNNNTYFLISAVTPIGKLLTGKKVGDSIQFNGKPIIIEGIK
jgi:transcription elongation GreA/GreB family factor